MNDVELASGLRAWFKRLCSASPQARRKSPVWVALREIVTTCGNWKNRPRGNPKRGYLVSRKNMDNQ